MPGSMFGCFIRSSSADIKDSDHDDHSLRDRHGVGATSFASTNGGASVSACESSLSATSIQTFASLASLPSLQLSSLLQPPHQSVLGGEHTCRFSLISSFSLSTSDPAVTAISPSDPPLLYCAAGGEVSVYDLDSSGQQQQLRRVSSFQAGGSRVRAFAFAPDGSRVFTAHHDRRVRVWSRRSSPSQQQNINIDVNKSRSASSPSSSSSTTASATTALLQKHRLVASLPTVTDRMLRAILPRNYITVRRHRRLLWIDHADAVSSLAVSPDGSLLYSGSWDKTVKVWSLSSLRCLTSIRSHDDAVNAVAVGNDGTLYTASADRRIRVWTRPQQEYSPPRSRSWKYWKWKRKIRQRHPHRPELASTLERHRSAVNALAVSPDGSAVYSGACDRSIVVWELEDSAGHMAASGALRGHQKAIMCLCAMDDLVVSGSTDRTVRVWVRGGGSGGGGGVGAYRCVAVLAGHRKGVRSVAACRVGPGPEDDGSPRGSVSVEYRVCSGSADGEVRVWRVCVGPGAAAAGDGVGRPDFGGTTTQLLN